MNGTIDSSRKAACGRNRSGGSFEIPTHNAAEPQPKLTRFSCGSAALCETAPAVVDKTPLSV